MKPTLLGLPYDASSSFRRGAAKAPAAIRVALASPSSNGWSETGLLVVGSDAVADEGDVTFEPGLQPRLQIESAIGAIVGRGDRPVSLGGDHSITYPILRALGPAHPDLTIVHIDAHADLYDEFEGDRYSHACPFARIMEEKLARRLVQVGIRTLSAHQREQAARYGVEVMDMRAWGEGERPVIAKGPVYLSIDIDAMDPAFAPGVSHHEPGGLTVRDVIGLVQRLHGSLVGADVVELNPDRDLNDVTAKVAAKLVKEVVSRMLETA
jgi:arginase